MSYLYIGNKNLFSYIIGFSALFMKTYRTDFFKICRCLWFNISQQRGGDWGDSILMGIGRDSFRWVRFDLLQTLFRYGPRGPKGQGMVT